MNSFNLGKIPANQEGSWSNEMNVQDRYYEAMARGQQQQQPRPQQRRPQQRRNNNAGRAPPPVATTETPPKDEPLYEGSISASCPVTTTLSHNIEYSSLLVILEEFWRVAVRENNLFERKVPLCMFTHVMVGILQMRIAQHQRFDNGDSLFDFIDLKSAFGDAEFKVPKVLMDYFDSICTSVTPTGEKIRINQPKQSIPQGPVPETADCASASAGTFGKPTASNHNLYECYISPYITHRLIERTIEAATTRDFGDWNPFPHGWIPNDARVTQNLLGYRPPRQLHSDAISVLRDLTFLDDSTFLGRIRYSSAAANQVSKCLENIKSIEMVPLEFKSKESISIFGYKDYNCNHIDEEMPIASISTNVKTPYALGAPMAFKCQMQGFKVLRTIENPGFMILQPDGRAYDGWPETINDNFNMKGEFKPRNLTADKMSLREAAHICTAATGKMEGDVSTFITRCLKKEK